MATTNLTRGQLQRRRAAQRRALMTQRDKLRDQRDNAAAKIRALSDQIKSL